MKPIFSCVIHLCTALPLLLFAESNLADLANIHGGAVVQIGAPDATVVGKLAKTGRYSINVLGKNPDVISKNCTPSNFGYRQQSNVRVEKQFPGSKRKIKKSSWTKSLFLPTIHLLQCTCHDYLQIRLTTETWRPIIKI